MTRILDLCQKLQDLHLAGFCQQFRTPQELIARGIAAGHLAVLQIPFSHQIFCDELPGLSVDEVFSPSIYSHHIQEFLDVFLIGTAALHEDHTQNCHQETSLR